MVLCRAQIEESLNLFDTLDFEVFICIIDNFMTHLKNARFSKFQKMQKNDQENNGVFCFICNFFVNERIKYFKVVSCRSMYSEYFKKKKYLYF